MYRQDLIEAATRVIDSGWFVLGEEVAAFEENFAVYCGTRYCVGVGNGLDAISITLKAYVELELLKPGDKVAIPSNTFIATALAVSEAGLTPVLVPPNPVSHLIDCNELELLLATGVKAVVPVHLYGQLADVDVLKSLCDKYNLIMVEDCAQAHGASWRGGRAGSFGDAGAFSFFPGKNLGALGDGGAITTSNGELYEMVLKLRNYGSLAKYHHEVKGVNSRLDEIQAAFLSVKLSGLEKEIALRREIASRFRSEIKNPLIVLPEPRSEDAHVWHLFVIKSSYRDSLKLYLDQNGVDTLIHYPLPIASQPAFHVEVQRCSISDEVSKQILSLPIDPYLTEAEVDRVIRICNLFTI